VNEEKEGASHPPLAGEGEMKSLKVFSQFFGVTLRQQ
jgi:hypothetical protein